MDIDFEIQAAIERVHALVDNRHARARAELRAMCEASRRSIGQRFRFVIPEALRRLHQRVPEADPADVSVVTRLSRERAVQLYLQESEEGAGNGRDGHPDGRR